MIGKRFWFYRETSKHDCFNYYISDEEYNDLSISDEGRTTIYYSEETK